jgi:hypothetical protein
LEPRQRSVNKSLKPGGTSLAWVGNALGNWTNTQAHAEVMDLLFDGPNHLGLNYARYNIGGGQNPLLLGSFRSGVGFGYQHQSSRLPARVASARLRNAEDFLLT